MGEEGKEDIVTNGEYCPGKLNFNAPLLTTRRPAGMKTLEMPRARVRSLRVSRDFSTSSSLRIPFSWEQTPGKPKNLDTDVRNNNVNVDLNNFLPPPPPKLPPCRWIPEAAEANDDEDGFDGGVEDSCSKEKDDGDQSDAIDVFSLGQSVEEVVEPGDGFVEMFGFEGLIDRDRGGGGGYHSPNFMIQRFLPDAKALAANSSSPSNAADQDLDDQPSGGGLSRAISMRRRTYPTTTTTKGCGLDNFFPWKMKPKPCGTKNPVVFAAPLRHKPQLMHHQKRKVVHENHP